MNGLRIGSLCSGYGGLDMAVQAVYGGELAWVADPDPGAAAILTHHHPNVLNLGDITKTNWEHVARVDILTAGFPCQDISYAGRGEGIREGNRSGLWHVIADALGVLRPRLFIAENVAAIVGRRPGLDVVLADLARLGLDAEWTCVRASDVGATHRRERWFLAAHPADHGHERGRGARGRRPGLADGGLAAADAGRAGLEGAGLRRAVAERCDAAADASSDGRDEGRAEPARLVGRPDAALGGGSTPPDADRDGCAQVAELHSKTEAGIEEQRRDDTDGRVLAWGAYEPAIRRWEAILGRPAPRPTEPGANGQPRLTPVFTEWLMGLPAGHVTDVPGLSRNAQLKALGNGVVPQQAVAALVHLMERRAAA